MRITESTTVLLIRHAHTAAVDGWLCGRLSGVPLSSLGQTQAIALAQGLRSTTLAAIYSSPLERAVSTARAVAAQQSCEVETCDGLIEIDFGRWTGQTFAALANDPDWKAFNSARAAAVIPEGERPDAAQTRIIHTLATLAGLHQGTTIACVTHADIIRFALLHYQRRSLDEYHSLTIDPASISVVVLSGAGPDVVAINAGVGEHRFDEACKA
jgi:broad specificity phosphatase PhoE